MSESFRTFVLMAKLASPISIEEPIHLEGILYDVRFRRSPELKGTPLDCIGYRDGIPMCSASILVAEGLDGVAFGSTTAVKGITPSDLQRIGTPKGAPTKIGDMSPYRNQMRSYQLLSGVDRVLWQVHGDPDAILKMLTQVSLGAMRSRGYGRVSSWEVIECEADPADAGWFAEDRVLRILPKSVGMERFGDTPSNGMITTPRPGTLFWQEFDAIEMMAPSLHGSIMTGRAARQVLSF